jgi:hypothetical protein
MSTEMKTSEPIKLMQLSYSTAGSTSPPKEMTTSEEQNECD